MNVLNICLFKLKSAENPAPLEFNIKNWAALFMTEVAFYIDDIKSENNKKNIDKIIGSIYNKWLNNNASQNNSFVSEQNVQPAEEKPWIIQDIQQIQNTLKGNPQIGFTLLDKSNNQQQQYIITLKKNILTEDFYPTSLREEDYLNN